MNKLASKKDIIILTGIIIFAVALWYVRGLYYTADFGVKCAEIIYEGKTVKNVPLDTNMIFSIDDIPAVKFEINNYAIAFIESDCPDKICVNTGFISEGGHSAACLPNRLVVRVVDINGDIDAAVY